MIDLFGEKPRRPRRVLMHVIDAGDCADAGYSVVARFQCTRCEAETDWLKVENVTTAKRGIPCEACNKPKEA
jgi:DNA-directed RNA polymerase subunit RPC12/RpoP